MILTHADLQEIIRLLDDSDYDELEVETDRFRLVLRRGADGTGGWSAERRTLATPEVINPPQASGHEAEGPELEPGLAAGDETGMVDITAPLVGTFYRAPRPGAEPFVEPGAQVGPDSVVAIIEVMKLMYSVVAKMRGVVVDICVENGALVQQGQRLMRLRVPEKGAPEAEAR